MRHLERLISPMVDWEVVGCTGDGDSHCVRRAILRHLSTSVAHLPDTSHAQAGKYTNDYSNNVFFSLGEVNSQLPVRHPLSSSLARSLDNSQNLALSTIVRAMISTIFAPSWRRTWMRITKAHVVDTQSVGTDVRWPFEWRLPQERSQVGRAAKTRSTQRTSTVISLSSSGAYCFSLAE